MYPPDKNGKYLRIAEVIAFLKISRSTLYKWMNHTAGFPQPIKAGPRVSLFDAEEIEKFLKDRESK